MVVGRGSVSVGCGGSDDGGQTYSNEIEEGEEGEDGSGEENEGQHQQKEAEEKGMEALC